MVTGSSNVALDCVVLDYWAHDVRAALRITLWKAAAYRRADMAGLEAGVDREATNCTIISDDLVHFMEMYPLDTST